MIRCVTDLFNSHLITSGWKVLLVKVSLAPKFIIDENAGSFRFRLNV